MNKKEKKGKYNVDIVAVHVETCKTFSFDSMDEAYQKYIDIQLKIDKGMITPNTFGFGKNYILDIHMWENFLKHQKLLK